MTRREKEDSRTEKVCGNAWDQGKSCISVKILKTEDWEFIETLCYL